MMEDDRAREQTYALWLLLGLPDVGLIQCCFSRRPISSQLSLANTSGVPRAASVKRRRARGPIQKAECGVSSPV